MKKIFLAIATTFGLNFVWEISQSFLYAPHYRSLGELINIHLWASGGDVVMVAGILLADEFVFKRIFKGENEKRQRLLAIVFVGFLLAVLVEKYALANSMWSYNAWMPVLPELNVGLTPVLQMMLIPLVTQLFLENRK